MATAISENADALRERAEAEQKIREENDRLTHEHVRLKKQGLITDLIPIELIRTSKLTRIWKNSKSRSGLRSTEMAISWSRASAVCLLSARCMTKCRTAALLKFPLVSCPAARRLKGFIGVWSTKIWCAAI